MLWKTKKTNKPVTLYQQITQAKSENKALLAILLDPDKIVWETIGLLVSKINASPANYIFVGGSLVLTTKTDELIMRLKQDCNLPVILFPGNPSQVSGKADAILFLSLISGRNPDFLIGHHVEAAPLIKKTGLEVIPTGYILIGNDNTTAVSTVSKTQPLPEDDIDYIVHTAQAGEMLGKKLIYLEAGSGAKSQVAEAVIKRVSENVQVPVIVGGGIRDKRGILRAYHAGADLVVIGTAFEEDLNFFNQ